MAKSYLPLDRDQQFLLPPSMRDWLPEGHLVWFVLEVVERVDTSALHASHPNDGAGRRAYHPDMLLALLIYAYCTGMRSSRRIERLCEVDVAYRVLCAGHLPDHTTIARFRQEYEHVAVNLFVEVLELCAVAGLASVGVVAVDGTKMAAKASLRANRTRAQLEAEVRAMFVQADDIDAGQDRLWGEARGDELPAELADPRRRAVRLDAARQELDRRHAARQADWEAECDGARRAWEQLPEETRRRRPGRRPAVVELDEAEQVLARAEARQAERARRWAQKEAGAAVAGRKLKGTRPVVGRDDYFAAKARRRLRRARQQAARRRRQQLAAARQDQVNVTDLDSRIMITPSGWVQGYNAQAAVNQHGVVVAGMVVNDAADVGSCQPMMTLTKEYLAAAGIDTSIGTMLFDAGYWSAANATAAGPDRLIATTKSWKLRNKAKTQGFVSGSPPPEASPLQAMEHRLQTAEGCDLYAKRATTVEPVFGQHKDGRGFRGFVQRGLAAVNAEWQLINTTHNMLKLFRAGVTLS
jgi:transposase